MPDTVNTADASNSPQKTRVSKKWLVRTFGFAIFVCIFGCWGLFDAVIAYPKRGANVASQAVAPADLLATMWHLLGVDPRLELRDRLGRPRQLSPGRVLADLLV